MLGFDALSVIPVSGVDSAYIQPLDFIAVGSVGFEPGITPVLDMGFIGSGLTVFEIVLAPILALDSMPAGSVVYQPLVYGSLPERIGLIAHLVNDAEFSALLRNDARPTVTIVNQSADVKLTQEPTIQ